MDTNTAGLLGLVTTEEAARLLGVTPSAIRQRIRRNRLPVVKVGCAILVSLNDLGATFQRKELTVVL